MMRPADDSSEGGENNNNNKKRDDTANDKDGEGGGSGSENHEARKKSSCEADVGDLQVCWVAAHLNLAYIALTLDDPHAALKSALAVINCPYRLESESATAVLLWRKSALVFAAEACAMINLVSEAIKHLSAALQLHAEAGGSGGATGGEEGGSTGQGGAGKGVDETGASDASITWGSSGADPIALSKAGVLANLAIVYATKTTWIGPDRSPLKHSVTRIVPLREQSSLPSSEEGRAEGCAHCAGCWEKGGWRLSSIKKWGGRRGGEGGGGGIEIGRWGRGEGGGGGGGKGDLERINSRRQE